jgi:hypothetical protein
MTKDAFMLKENTEFTFLSPGEKSKDSPSEFLCCKMTHVDTHFQPDAAIKTPI